MAQKKYEVSFQLGGEVQGSFSRAFSSAQDKFRGTEKSAKHLNDQVDNSTRKFGGLTSMFHKTSSGASAMTSSLKTAAGAIAGLYVVKKGIDVGKTLIDQYQSSFRIIKTGTGAAGKNLDGLIDSYHNLGAVVPDDLKDVATVMSDFNTRVGATGKVLEDLTGKTLSLSAIASADLGETVKQSTRMFGDWSIPLEKGGETLDKLYITSQNTGIGIEALAEKMTTFGGPLRQMGFDFETSMAIMGKWEKEGVNAELVLGSLRIALGKMAKAGVKDTNKALNIVIDKVQKAKTTGQATALAMEAFGSKAGPDMAAAIREGRFELGKLAEDLKTAKGAIDKDFADTETLDDKIATIRNKFLVAAEPLGKAAADAIGGVLADVGTELTGMGNQLNKIINADAWKNADLSGKMHIAWSDVISKPLNTWWGSSGKTMVYDFGVQTGNALGKGLWTGFKALLSESSKVFSGGGATSWLSLAILGKTASKTAKTVAPLVSSIGKFVKPATAAATAAGAVAEGTGLMAGAAAALTNPLGWAAIGVGTLAGGWYLYKRHQENARQSLIHMGDTLKTALSDYSAIETQTKKTEELVEEYNRLTTKISDSKTPAEELAEAKRKLVNVEIELKDMFPEIISQYDIENGKVKEKIDLINQEKDAKSELGRLRLERESLEGTQKAPKLEKEISKLENQKEKKVSTYDAYAKAIPTLRTYYAELQKIMSQEQSKEQNSQLEELVQKVQEAGREIGYSPQVLMNMENDIDSLVKKQIELSKDLEATSKELVISTDSYQQIYDTQKKVIELNLGGKLEDQAKSFNSLSEDGKKNFNLALNEVAALNRELDKIPVEKEINIKALFEMSGQTFWDMPSMTDAIKNRFPAQSSGNTSIPKFAKGGFSNQPSIFAEDGLEAAIPINNKPRSHAILDRVNRMMGHTEQPKDWGFAETAPVLNRTNQVVNNESNTTNHDVDNSSEMVNKTNVIREEPISIHVEPTTIVIQGNADDKTANQLKQILQENNDRLTGMIPRLIEDYQKNKRRVSMSGPV